MITNNQFFIITVFFCLFNSCKKEELPEQFGTFIDVRDNQEYNWVRIGNQIWMAENFAYSPEIYSDTVNSGIWVARFKWIMPMSAEEKQKVREERGCLYSWKRAKELCPAGWHLPTDDEWMEMEQYLGMNTEELTKEGERGVDKRIGGKLKETGTLFWYPPTVELPILRVLRRGLRGITIILHSIRMPLSSFISTILPMLPFTGLLHRMVKLL